MKSIILLLTTMLIAGMSMADTDTEKVIAEDLKKWDELEKVVCADKTKITDQQVSDIKEKCQCKDAKDEHVKKGDEIAKTCLKVAELTDRQKVASVCDQKECLSKNWSEYWSKQSAENLTKHSDKFDTYLKCVKTIIKTQEKTQ